MSTATTVDRQLPAFRPIRATRAFEEVANQVLEMVDSGALQPGDRLPSERDFSRQLEVSRSALREALRLLEHSGVVELRKGKTGGAFITTRSEPIAVNPVAELFRLGNLTLSDMTEARFWITEVVVRVASERARKTDFELLAQNVALAEQQFQLGLFDEKSDTNIEFHNLLARATRNPVLVTMIAMLNEVIRGFARQLGTETTRRTFNSRHRLLKAMHARDPDLAAREMLANLKKTHDAYIALARARGTDNPAKKAVAHKAPVKKPAARPAKPARAAR